MKFVTNLDWSTDSRFLQSVDGDFELHNCKLTKQSSSVWMKTFLNNFPALQCITLNTNFFKNYFSGNIQRMEREDARTLRDCNWQTYSCCAGHPLMGMTFKIFFVNKTESPSNTLLLICILRLFCRSLDILRCWRDRVCRSTLQLPRDHHHGR